MKNYLVIYYAPDSSSAKMENATEEEKMAGMKPWMDWKAAHEENVVNFGAPLIPGLERGANSDWQHSEKEVSGFSILQAENKEAVQAALNDHPHYQWADGSKVGVYEFAPM